MCTLPSGQCLYFRVVVAAAGQTQLARRLYYKIPETLSMQRVS